MYAPWDRITALALLLLLSAATAQADSPSFSPVGIRGMTIGPIESSQQPERGYGTDASAAVLDELVRNGINTISITPFGRLWSLSSTEIQLDFEAPYEDNRRAVAEIVQQAHARGLRVILIPHLWVETGGWRGEVDPQSIAGWKAYRESYRRFLLAWAKDAADFGVDALSIGVECVSWSGRYGAYWTDLIDRVRALFPGPLTYSANWDEVDNVLFWDQLDWIGVNAFYPLAAADNAPYTSYVEGATRAVRGLATLSELHDKPVMLMEIGYTTRENAAVQPWLWPDHMQDVRVDEWEQARALSALMTAVAMEPKLLGFLVWRYYAHLDDVSQEAPWGFSTYGKLADHVLQAVVRQRWATDPSSQRWITPLAPRLQRHTPHPWRVQPLTAGEAALPRLSFESK